MFTKIPAKEKKVQKESQIIVTIIYITYKSK